MTVDTDIRSFDELLRVMRGVRRDLARVATLLRTQTAELGVGGSPVPFELKNWPVRGRARSLLTDKRSMGHDNFVVPATTASATDLTSYAPGRVGGSIVNSGANPCFFYLARAGAVVYQQGGIASGYLTTAGSWDFKWSGAIWCGPVSVISPLGTTLTWGQL